MKIQILDKLWTLRYVRPLKDCYGDCDSPDKVNREIRISKGLPSKKECEILIHESLHAADWYKDEEWIKKVSKDITDLLWKVGFRKIDK